LVSSSLSFFFMMRTTPWRGLLSLLLLLAGTACQITKPYVQPEMRVEALYRDQTPTDTTNLAQLPWRTLFTDPQLQALIAEGIASNLDLQVAATRVQQAEATFRQSQAAFFPTLAANATVTHSKQAAFPGFGAFPVATQYQLFGDASWEADVWGRLRNTKKSALAQLRQS
jgi:outer membrane protein TolC